MVDTPFLNVNIPCLVAMNEEAQEPTIREKREQRYRNLEPKLFKEAERRYGPETRQFLKECRERTHAGDFTEVLEIFIRDSVTSIRTYSDRELMEVVFNDVEEHAAEYGLCGEVENR